MPTLECSVQATVDIEREVLSTGDSVYVATCREVEIASQGESLEEATANVKAALQLWIETASPSEIERRFGHVSEGHQVYTTRIEVPYGQPAGSLRG